MVGDLAHEACDYLGSNTAIVSVTGESIRHFYARNRAITDFEIITMSYGLRHGLIIADSQKPNCVIINYVFPDTQKRYKIAVKSANNKTELWVSTFHRLRPRQSIALLKRGVIIRTHD
jgi:hypothetical protein